MHFVFSTPVAQPDITAIAITALEADPATRTGKISYQYQDELGNLLGVAEVRAVSEPDYAYIWENGNAFDHAYEVLATALGVTGTIQP